MGFHHALITRRPQHDPLVAIFRYLLALLATGVALAIALALDPIIDRGPFALLLAAVMFSAVYGGLGPGLLATLLSSVASTYVFIEPRYTLAVPKPTTALEILIFASVALLISSLSGNLRRARQRAEVAWATSEQVRREVQAANDRLRTIQYVTDAALAHLPLDHLLRELLGRLRALLDVDGVAVVLDSGDDQQLAVVIGRGGEVVYKAAPLELSRTQEPDGRRRGETHIVDRVSTTGDVIPVLRDAGVRSWLGAPLLVEGRILGDLQVGTTSERQFTADDVRLLRLVADRMALAISQSRLYEAERAARSRAERLAAERSATLAYIADGVIVTNAASRVTFMNDAARNLLGMNDKPLADMLLQDLPLVDADGNALGESDFGRPPAPGTTVLGTELVSRRDNSAELVLIGSAAPVVLEDGTLRGAVRTLHDITAQRELDRQRQEFFANASHDLRTPVATIKASIDVVLRNMPAELPDVLHRLLVNIDREADRMTTLVDDLLELTRLRSARVAPRRAKCDLRTIGEHACRAVESLAESRHQTLELSLPGRRVTGEVDAERLERAIVNLLANAYKYGREGGTIRLGLSLCRREAVFSVEDDGPGIALDDRERIFQRFYRADSAATRRQQGSGLGLPIARATAELHGGRVWVEQSALGGAAFHLSVPVVTHR